MGDAQTDGNQFGVSALPGRETAGDGRTPDEIDKLAHAHYPFNWN